MSRQEPFTEKELLVIDLKRVKRFAENMLSHANDLSYYQRHLITPYAEFKYIVELLDEIISNRTGE